VFEKLEWFESELSRRNLALELIFVDDGSQDSSFARLMEFKKRRPATKIIKLIRNFGAVAASTTGYQYVTGDCFTILAADLQDPVEKVLEMVEKWIEGYRFVICVREKREDPPTSKLFAWFYYLVVKALVIKDYPRGGFDMMLLDKTLLPYMIRSGSNLNPNMYAYWLGVPHASLSYIREKRRHGKSRWTFTKKFNFFLDTITGFSVSPIRLASLFGLTVACVSLLYGGWILINAFFGEKFALPGFATLAILISFFSGLILFILAVMGEYLRRIFDIAINKPKSIVEETFL
jgi:dolichol-phosphate mannosyltransferase